ncbi:MAG: DUF1926 domain-containing protein [Spirochaetia bacterium]|nr:DUF1926 domain-containing protein [Spirochaetia bacterium]
MGQKKLILGFYDQKPLGTRLEDYEFSLYSCYKPLLTYLYTNPEIRIALYLSGTIYEWLESDYPEINMLISDMVKRKQIELLTGGFYDPILQIIPNKDRTLQIEMTTTLLRKRFGYRPRCGWISEQVWNPVLINTLSLCGIKSMIQFHTSVRENPYYMQEMGKTITIFPVDTALSTALLGNALDEFHHLISIKAKKESVSHITLMLDMNKIISNSIIETKNNIVELCKVFKDTCEMYEMTSALITDETFEEPIVQDYLPYGWYKDQNTQNTVHFNELFIKYPEIQRLYGKLLFVSRLIPGIKKEKSLKKLAIKELLKAESFGGFSISQNGGMYQNYLRKRNYHHLIEGEKISREKGVFSTSITMYDMDLDTEDEVIYRGKNITTVFDRIGGSMIELDYLVNSWNYLDTFVGHSDDLTRRSIPSMPDGICQNTFTDLFVYPEAQSACYDKYSDAGVLTLEGESYELGRFDKDKKQVAFSFTTTGLTGIDSIEIEKLYTCHTNTIQVDYRIRNCGRTRVQCKFGSELNLSFSGDTDDLVEFHSSDANHVKKMGPQEFTMKNVKQLRISDLNKKAMVSILAEKRYHMIRQNYSTTISTLMGEEDIYQFTRILPLWELDLRPGEQWENQIAIRIEKLR